LDSRLSAGCAEAVEDDAEQAAGPTVELGRFQAGQVADQNDHVAGVHVGADRARGAAGVEQAADRVADRAVAVRREVLPGADSIDDPATRAQIRDDMSRFAIAPEAVARAIAFAIEQPADVEIGDMTIRPTRQG
jgi:hypothetical protein